MSDIRTWFLLSSFYAIYFLSELKKNYNILVNESSVTFERLELEILEEEQLVANLMYVAS